MQKVQEKRAGDGNYVRFKKKNPLNDGNWPTLKNILRKEEEGTNALNVKEYALLAARTQR